MTDAPIFNPVPVIANETSISSHGVEAVIKLLSDGNTVPFIARYRKEMTGGLDENQIRLVEERNTYLVDLEKRRQAILSSISDQGKLTAELEAQIRAAATKAVLEDLYLPYKPKRRTKATIAREKGLEPLGLRILEQPQDGDPRAEARAFIDMEKGVEDEDSALQGARDIAAEAIGENAKVRTLARERYARHGMLVSIVVSEEKDGATKYKDYFDYREPVGTIPSHRFLAVRRGEREGVLKLRVEVDHDRLSADILETMGYREVSPFGEELRRSAEDAYKRFIATGVESDLRVDLKMNADRGAVDIFANNLKSLLLAPPYGTQSVLGVDPGLRTGCKCAMVDATGKFLGTMTFNLVLGTKAVEKAKSDFLSFFNSHKPSSVAVGNGTGGREAEKFIRKTLDDGGFKKVLVVQVSESGASVYSASALAGKEFPDLDLTIRGAISIARRLQDPLAELVKVEPKSIGVGQYQHDVHQPLLSKMLDEVVESCVNHVGVELNTASAPLLSRVAGIGPAVATNIVAHREQKGVFKERKELLKVAKLGPRTFEQAAGFLRIRGGANPLDASAVHPERYKLVARIAKDKGMGLESLVGNREIANQIEISKYVGEGVGELTLRDIVDELGRPGRDPREVFEAPAFRDDVNAIQDLTQGMELQGIVTNVTAFGAFVDVGVHQDGLVHISQLADRFVKDPNEVVKAGDKINVRVLDVDLDRKRISLSAKTGTPAVATDKKRKPTTEPKRPPHGRSDKNRGKSGSKEFSYNPFRDLLKK
jgi:uncharacterized protein